MIKIRKAAERGLTQIDWLESYHTFSFDQYEDPKYRRYRTLRVINEDFIRPGQGFQPHSHRDMEILTYMIDGAVAHKDSEGNEGVIRRGEIQLMSAGTGITHSEFNHSKTESAHLLQIWIFPEAKGLKPGYAQHPINTQASDSWQLLADKTGAGNSLRIRQDVKVMAAFLSANSQCRYELPKSRYLWVQVVKGTVRMDQETLTAGDGAAVEGISEFKVQSIGNAELLLFDMA